MDIKGVLLTLGSALCVALYMVAKKAEFNRNGKFWNTRAALFTGLINGSASALLFLIALFYGGIGAHGNWWMPLVATALLNSVIQFANTKAYITEDASLVGPIAATTPATIIFASMIITGELPSALGWLGINLIVIGTYALNIQAYLEKRASGSRTWKDWFAPFLMLTKSQGVRWAFAAALIASVSINFDALAYRRANVAFVAGCLFATVGITNLLAAWRNKEIKIPLRKGGVTLVDLSLLVALHTGAIWLGNTAFQHGIVPYLGTLRRVQIPLVIILAYFFLGEKANFRSRLLGGMLMTAGVVLIVI